MNRIHHFVDFLLGIILGFSIALLITWWIVPIPRFQTTPSALHPSYKDEYRLLVALAYNATGDLDRARLRLLTLQEGDSVAPIVDQAVRFRSDQSESILYPGISISLVQYLALLARDLQNIPIQVPSTLPYTPATTQIHPTVTYHPFFLLSSDPVCNASTLGSLAQIFVSDSMGQSLPMVPIVVAWETGQQKIFTGLKPEKGSGYADFIMRPGMSYSIQLPASSQVVTGISPPECISEDGSTYPGGLVLIFQQP